jgi:hypothetical protein
MNEPNLVQSVSQYGSLILAGNLLLLALAWLREKERERGRERFQHSDVDSEKMKPRRPTLSSGPLDHGLEQFDFRDGQVVVFEQDANRIRLQVQKA